MPKQKKRLKRGIIFLLILILVILFYVGLIYFIIGDKIKNIYIYGNNNLTDQEIIEQSKLENYPNFYTTTTSSIAKKLKKNSLIKQVIIKKKFFQQIHIYVEEYNILFKKLEDNKYVLENGKEISLSKDITSVPILINYVPNTKITSFVSKLNEIDSLIIQKISEIKYDPTELDEDRFLLYMNDENYVYVTLTKLYLLNKYNEAVEQLEGKKGILYLDSGNYFEIMD